MTENDGYEIAYHNGKERMREEILNKLLAAKGNAMGIQRAVLTEVIEMVRKLEVTQEDTLKFDHRLPVKIQLRVKTKTGQALSMKPRTVSVDECLDGEVLV